MHNFTALITGASAGIGTEFAKALSRRSDLNLLLVARREERLTALAETITNGWPKDTQRRCFVCATDLSTDQGRANLLNFLQNIPPVSLLVNNAGFGSVGSFADQHVERQLEMIQLNCVAPVHLTSALLPLWRQGTVKNPAIINVASICAFPPMPYMATYGATKAFLLSFSAALREELKAQNIRVLALCPGPTATEFHIAAGIEDKIAILSAMSSELVVEQALDSLERNSGIRINGALNTLLSAIGHLVPPGIAARIIAHKLRPYA